MTTVLGLRVVAALAAGARPAKRPNSTVVHLFTGPATRSGRYGSSAGGTVCGTRTRRLSFHEGNVMALQSDGLRFCRRCTSLLPASLGTGVRRLVARTDVEAAYRHLTVGDLEVAARWTTTVADTHLVGRVASVVLGPPKMFGRRTPDEQRVFDLDRFLIRRRDQLRTRELTTDEIEERRARQEAEATRDALVLAGRKRADARDRALDRHHQGGYLTPWERDLVNTA